MIRIAVDSSADYSLEELTQKQIDLIPLIINLNGKSYRGGIDITADEIYELLLSGSEFPTTSQPSPQDFLDLFEQVQQCGDSLIYITLSGGLSGTVQTANMMKNMTDYPEIYVIDSLTGTHAIRLIVDYACKLRNEGHSASDIVQKLQELVPRVQLFAGMDTLEFVYKGGRLNKATAVIGELANLKPIITLTRTEGKISIIGKCIGKNKANAFITKLLASKTIDTDFPVYSIYSRNCENAQKLAQKLETIGVVCDDCLALGATLGVHIGPDAFGVVFVEKANA